MSCKYLKNSSFTHTEHTGMVYKQVFVLWQKCFSILSNIFLISTNKKCARILILSSKFRENFINANKTSFT